MERPFLPLREKELYSFALNALKAAKEGNFEMAKEFLIRASGTTNSLILALVHQITGEMKRLMKEKELKEIIDYFQKEAQNKLIV